MSTLVKVSSYHSVLMLCEPLDDVDAMYLGKVMPDFCSALISNSIAKCRPHVHRISDAFDTSGSLESRVFSPTSPEPSLMNISRMKACLISYATTLQKACIVKGRRVIIS